jgi:pyruvate formate lyase activating enzyme
LTTGRIFDIKRFAVHDGPGIRTTVFLKGCPLACRWCHNPEGIGRDREFMLRPARCAKCYDCLAVCPPGALSKGPAGEIVVDRSNCDLCGRCVEACLSEALEIVGRDVSVPELIVEVEKDRVFYEQSGGGVTFSGGEPLLQPEFLAEALTALRARGLRTAVDTSGFAPPAVLERIASLTDLVLYDLKVLDEAKHLETTGVANALILENLRRLAGGPTRVWIRIPLVPGVNDDDVAVGRTADFLASLGSIRRVHLLPYHRGGIAKGGRIGREENPRIFAPPDPARIAAVVAALAARGFEAVQGG